MLRNCANSLSENDPEPSAILLVILIPAALSCSANLYSFLSSRSFATTSNDFVTWIPSFQISKSSNLNTAFIFLFSCFAPCVLRFAPCALLPTGKLPPRQSHSEKCLTSSIYLCLQWFREYPKHTGYILIIMVL
jgi:hypothetical protein